MGEAFVRCRKRGRKPILQSFDHGAPQPGEVSDDVSIDGLSLSTPRASGWRADRSSGVLVLR